MHHAPALTLTLQPDRRWFVGLRTAACTGLLLIPGWLGWHVAVARIAAPSGPMLVAASLSALPCLWLLWRTRTNAVQRSTLSWQPGDALWTLQINTKDGTGMPRSGHLDCVVEGKDWLLLRHGGPGIASTWCPVSRHRHAAQWHALRCAVFSPGVAVHMAPAAVSDE